MPVALRTTISDRLFAFWIIIGVLQVWHVDCPAFEHSTTGWPFVIKHSSGPNRRTFKWPGLCTSDGNLTIA